MGDGERGGCVPEPDVPEPDVPEPDVTETIVSWCRHHGPAIHAYLVRRTGHQGADDLFGEVWLRAYAARATYDVRLGDPLPWLYGIARNVLRAHWRFRDRREAALHAVTADPWADADDRLDAGTQLKDLHHALQRLSAEEREVLLLVAWERLTPAEVARALDIPQGTARSRLHRARQLMQGELDSRPVVLITTANEENHR
jgi:RNA polymerase sigma factor (sigma-70 family)